MGYKRGFLAGVGARAEARGPPRESKLERRRVLSRREQFWSDRFGLELSSTNEYALLLVLTVRETGQQKL